MLMKFLLTDKLSVKDLRGVCFVLSPSRKSEQRAQSHERKHHPHDHQVGTLRGVPSGHPLCEPSGPHHRLSTSANHSFPLASGVSPMTVVLYENFGGW